MISLESETLIPIRDVPKRLPARPGGKRIHISAIYRWMQRGVRGVRLESVRVGGTTYTSTEALQRFSDGLGTAGQGASVRQEPVPRIRQRQIELASAEVSRLLQARSGGA